MKRLMAMVLLAMLLVAWAAVPAMAQEPAYPILLEDEAELLTPEEEASLQEAMGPIAQHGAVAFWTTTQPGNVDAKAEEYFNTHIGTKRTDSGVVFMIDMSERQIYIFSRGEIEKHVSRSDAYAITADISHYATKGAYADCAQEAFSRMGSRLEGKQLHSTMRLVCSMVAGIAAGLMLAYVIVCRFSLHRTPAGQATRYRSITGSGRVEPCARVVVLFTSGGDYGSGGSYSGGSSRGGGGGGGRSAGGSGGGSSF